MSAKRPSPEEIAEQLREITVALRRRARAESVEKTIPVPGQTIPYPQLSVLKRLEGDGPASTAHLARTEAMTPQSMGAIVAALENAGYAERRDDSSHGRRRLASITAAGRRALAVNRAVRLRWLAAVIAERFDADEQRTIASALSLLRTVLIS